MRLHETWDWVTHSPVFFLLVTLAGYELGRTLRARTAHPLAQPVLVAVVLVVAVISGLHIDYRTYRSGAGLIAFLLGPATVALAIPLHRQTHRLRGVVGPMLVALVAGSVVSVASGIVLVRLLGGSEALARTMGPKSTTTPVAIALADRFDGIPELAAVFAIIVGTLGAVLGPTLLDRLRIGDPRARGLAVGAVSHGIGTARMLHESPVEGAFAGLSMGLTALVTCIVMPLLVPLLL